MHLYLEFHPGSHLGFFSFQDGSDEPVVWAVLHLHINKNQATPGKLVPIASEDKEVADTRREKRGIKRGWREEGNKAGCCTPGGKSRSALLRNWR